MFHFNVEMFLVPLVKIFTPLCGISPFPQLRQEVYHYQIPLAAVILLNAPLLTSYPLFPTESHLCLIIILFHLINFIYVLYFHLCWTIPFLSDLFS